MEQKFGKNSILGRAKRPSRADIEALREFCEREFVADYPCVLSGQPSQATIEAMMPRPMNATIC